MNDQIKQNSVALFSELDWAEQAIHQRLEWLKKTETVHNVLQTPPPVFETTDESAYATFLRKYQFTPPERLMLALSIARSFKPDIFEKLIDRNSGIRLIFPELGGVINNVSQKFVPTLHTAVGVLAGKNAAEYGFYFALLRHSELIKEQIIHLENPIIENEDLINETLKIVPEYLEHFLESKMIRPVASRHFPAQMLEGKGTWDDVVLDDFILMQVKKIIDWSKYKHEIFKLNQNKVSFNEGFPALFYGPPGTGKTMVASLIGKAIGKEVYRIDLSMIVSKYIGETEKNLAKLFDRAENKDWILFFDEADALFSKRTQVKDSHDKHANQEMAYLLQRMESFPGITILTTNLAQNIDVAMTRRFQVKVKFTIPSWELRAKLWKKHLPFGFTMKEGLDWNKLAQKFTLSGANIVNIYKMCCLDAIKNGSTEFNPDSLLENINIELAKEGKTA